MKNYTLLLFSLLFIGIINSKAQYTILHNFNDTNGGWPYGNLTLSGNKFYGMAHKGGPTHDSGCIFSIDTNGNGFKGLFYFNGTNGALPYGSLTISGSKLFGMTSSGGATHDSGCIFSIDTNGSGFKDLLDFNGTNGALPYGSLTISGGKLFGMTSHGGAAHDSGCIFSIDTNGSAYKDLLDFNGINGAYPFGDLTFPISGKTLYGMTSSGGANNVGTIFSIDTNGSGYKDLLDFNGTNGEAPQGSLTLSGNKLFAMSYLGGGNGNIFSIDTNGIGYKEVFKFNGTNGEYPLGNLTLLGNVMYGMTWQGGGGFSHYGVLFALDTNGSKFKDLIYFNSVNGAGGIGSLSISGNTLYGMTSGGGAYIDGVIFKVDTSSSASIDELTANSGETKLFPNPNNGKFTIELTLISDHSSVEIYNTLGEKIYSETFSTFHSQLSINLASESAGVYLYRILSETGALISKGRFIIGQ